MGLITFEQWVRGRSACVAPLVKKEAAVSMCFVYWEEPASMGSMLTGDTKGGKASGQVALMDVESHTDLDTAELCQELKLKVYRSDFLSQIPTWNTPIHVLHATAEGIFIFLTPTHSLQTLFIRAFLIS